MGIKIIGTGSYAPEKILTNADLEKMVDTTDEWISTRTGIKERRIANDDTCTSDLASEAARNAMEMANVKAEDIDLIIVATITADRVFPSTACYVQNKIEAKNAVSFDISAACSGLLYGIEIAESMLKSKSNYKTAMIIGAEKLSWLVDWEDRNTCVLFGDGAGAVIIQEFDGESKIIDSCLGSDGNYTELLHTPGGGSALPLTAENINDKLQYLKMEGQEVFKLAVNSMVGACLKVMEDSNVSPEQIKWLIPHQANYRILKAVAKRLNISEDNVYMNLDKYGNTSAASIGIAMDEMNRLGKVSENDYVLFTAFGGGLTWGATLVKW